MNIIKHWYDYSHRDDSKFYNKSEMKILLFMETIHLRQHTEKYEIQQVGC